jgi:hypothetical protein
LALQVLVLQRINLGGDGFNHISLFIYPLFLMLLPMQMPRAMQLFVAFLSGLVLDYFMSKIGMHTATAVFMVFIRSTILAVIEPAGGYKESSSPTKRRFGFLWFVKYAAIFVLLYCFYFFSVEYYTFVRWADILRDTMVSSLVSFVLVMIYVLLFDPQE